MTFIVATVGTLGGGTAEAGAQIYVVRGELDIKERSPQVFLILEAMVWYTLNIVRLLF